MQNIDRQAAAGRSGSGDVASCRGSTGDTWVHLRLCGTCGHVGCCDDSKYQHATKHFPSAGHPIITSLEHGETWSWCYIDQLAMELS